MNWNELKENLYFEDGSLRDVYVFNVNIDEWRGWVDFVNQKYQVEFVYGENNIKTSAIDFAQIKNFWSGESEFVNLAKIRIGNIQINCHFFIESEFENDISPNEFNSFSEHQLLVEYMQEVSKLFKKDVFLTGENTSSQVLLKVEYIPDIVR